jgi:hypothetical protein
MYNFHSNDARQDADEDASLGERRRHIALRDAGGERGAHLTCCGVEGIEHPVPRIQAIDGLTSYDR